jgi:hypothetical protein
MDLSAATTSLGRTSKGMLGIGVQTDFGERGRQADTRGELDEVANIGAGRPLHHQLSHRSDVHFLSVG